MQDHKFGKFKKYAALMILISILGLPGALTVSAKTRAKASKAAHSPTPAPSATAAAKANANAAKTLWDEWYTVTLNSKIKYQYYNERVEKREGRIFLRSDVWKKEEDFINRESLGSVSNDDENLTPAFFNFHSTYRTTETQIDGTFADKSLTVKVHRGSEDLPVIKRGFDPKAFLSGLFPVWMGRKISQLKEGQSISFYTVLEDNLEAEFSPISGRIQLEKPDDFANQNKAVKVLVDYRGNKTTWYIDSRGSAIRIVMPEQNAVVNRVTRAQAVKFLD